MQQYFIEKKLENNVIIEGNYHKYLSKVVKVKIEEEIILFNGEEKAQYQIKEIDKEEIKLKKIKSLELVKNEYTIDLGVGLLKKDKLEWVIQKTTELGVNNIHLLKLQNNIVKFDNKIDKKLNRYNEIAISAVEQSKRDSLVNIKYLDEVEKIFEKYDYVFVAHEKYEEKTLLNKINEVEKNAKILFLVGPEGGFAPQEIEKFLYFKNVSLVSLGKNILKGETAAIIGIGIIKFGMDEK